MVGRRLDHAAQGVRRAAVTAPRHFAQVAVIDWSGEAVARPKGLALAHARGGEPPVLSRPDGGWSREGLLDWLRGHAEAASDLLIGLDLSPALPFLDSESFFPGWAESPADAKALWALVDGRCAADPYLSAGSFVADVEAARHFRQHRGRETLTGNHFGVGRGRLRVCEQAQLALRLSPSSCFNLVGAAQVGKSSLTGMRVLHRLTGAIPVWPFDPVPRSGPVIVEIYTSIAARAAGLRAGLSKMRDGATLDAALARLGCPAHAPLAHYDDHATDAILTAAWLRDAATRPALWSPPKLTPQIARTEGWTFGVP